jgi:hypothetical protein
VTIVVVAQLGDVSGTALDLIATLVTLTVAPGTELESTGGATALLAVFGPGGANGFGQGPGQDMSEETSRAGEVETANPPNSRDESGSRSEGSPGERLAPWARLAAGLEEAWEALRARLRDGEPSAPAVNTDQKAPAAVAPHGDGEGPSGIAPAGDRPAAAATATDSRPADADRQAGPADGSEPTGEDRTDSTERSDSKAKPMRGAQSMVAPDLRAVDRALEKLDESTRRCESVRVVPVVSTTVAERDDARSHRLLDAALASVAVAVAQDRAIAAARARRQKALFATRQTERRTRRSRA